LEEERIKVLHDRENMKRRWGENRKKMERKRREK
jgi:hypothetical protein